MDKDVRETITNCLGDPERDFQQDPLTQEEIHGLIDVCSEELERKDLNKDLRLIYSKCIEVLTEHIKGH